MQKNDVLLKVPKMHRFKFIIKLKKKIWVYNFKCSKNTKMHTKKKKSGDKYLTMLN